MIDCLRVRFLKEYPFDTLARGLGPLRDGWRRFQRRHPILPADVALTLRILACRLHPELRDRDQDRSLRCWALLDAVATEVSLECQTCCDVPETFASPATSSSSRSPALGDGASQMQVDKPVSVAPSAQDEILSEQEDLSEEEPLFELNGDESPHHLQQKFDQFPSAERMYNMFRTSYLQVAGM